MLIKQGVLTVPEDADVVEFIRTAGKNTKAQEKPPELMTLGKVRDAYLENHSNGSMEENSLKTLQLHFRHLSKYFGEKYQITKITQIDLQKYIDYRLKKKYRNKAISPTTAKKEITTIRSMWNFGIARGLVKGMFPTHGLTYPKTDAKLPFMTLAELEKKIAVGGINEDEKKLLYESLYLRKEEIMGLLEHTKTHAAHKWIFPLTATAALTGARLSELTRMEVTDVDFENEVLLIREKKRSKKQRTTRHVSLTPYLKNVLTEWLLNHPGGKFLFCQSEIVPRSKKRSATTRNREILNSEDYSRRELMMPREKQGICQLTKEEVRCHFKKTLSKSRWQVIRGLHVLRHSFISCLAAAGVDQRVIDDFVGHSTDEQRQRYRHLLPDLKGKAVAVAFG